MKDRSFFFLCFFVFIVCWLHGSLVGITDDESYYWYIAQRFSIGYTFHPPALEWVIAVFQKLTAPFFPQPHPAQLRLVSAFCTAGIFAIVVKWFSKAGIPSDRILRAVIAFLCLPAIFGSSWMVVPDLPMFLGITLALTGTWSICFETPKKRDYLAVCFGLCLGLLSKYTAVFAVASSTSCFLLWIPKRGSSRFGKAIFAVSMGVVLALIPILLWNYQEDWAPFRYHFSERHDGKISVLRWGRFWLVETLIAGPVLIFYGIHRFVKNCPKLFYPGSSIFKVASPSRFLLVWIVPGAVVFGLQPLVGDFKLHWPFVAWVPLAMEFAYRVAKADPEKSPRLIRAYRGQVAYGFFIIGFVLLSCHVPLIGFLSKAFTGKIPDPKWDVTNDMYGWSELPSALEKKIGPEALTLPVLTSRHQVAGQAAFAWGRVSNVSKVPHDLKETKDWPIITAVSDQGPAWPKVLQPILYVADNRYTAVPEYSESQCDLVGDFSFHRWELLARTFKVWKCVPAPKIVVSPGQSSR